MKKNFSIFGIRSGMIGDMVFALPILSYLERVYPNSYKYWVIGKRFGQAASLFLNHPLIDKIHILETPERLESENDINIANKCNIIFNVTPEHPDGPPGATQYINGYSCKSFWWNYFNAYQETIRMAGIDLNHFNSILTPEERNPKLTQWFDVNKEENTIAIWCMAGYGTQPKRSPKKEWWDTIILQLLKDYKIIRFGHPNEPSLNENIEKSDRFKDLRSLSFFDQIKLSIGCEVSISTNSGSSIILGAYGAKQITLLTDDAPNHINNFEAFGPYNFNGLNKNIISKNGFDLVNIETILTAIK